MPENAFNRPNSNSAEYDPVQASLQWMQQQLAEQGITSSPEEALKLFAQKRLHSARRWLQQDLAEHGIDATSDEAVAIQELHFIHLIMEHTVTTDPHEAI